MKTKVDVKIDRLKLGLVEEKTKDRFEQGDLDRIIEYITGFHLDDPELPNILIEDQKIIRGKYGLPDRQYIRENLSEYERFLKEILENNHVSLREKSDCGGFFEKYSSVAYAVYFDDTNSIGFFIDKSSIDEYFMSLLALEHETIHSLQHKFYPEMSIEQQEYEAHLAIWPTDAFKEKDSLQDVIFGILISVNHWYESLSEERGIEIKPNWNDPEYPLKNVDGVGNEAIQKYKIEHQIDVEK